MEKTETTTRMNISVPRDLRARMEKVNETANWSALACEAFQYHLARLDARSAAETLDEVIARMKVADRLDSDEQFREGLDAGERWARVDARPRELRVLQQFCEQCPDLESELEGFQGPAGPGIAMSLFRAIRKAKNPHHSDVGQFWSEALGDDWEAEAEDVQFMRGFVEGALSVWARVEGKI